MPLDEVPVENWAGATTIQQQPDLVTPFPAILIMPEQIGLEKQPLPMLWRRGFGFLLDNFRGGFFSLSFEGLLLHNGLPFDTVPTTTRCGDLIEGIW